MRSKQNAKYHKFYQDIASLASQQSVAGRRKVGAVVVSTSGMLATGWNGTPPGFSNECERSDGSTRPEVIHAERNAIDKMTLEGISTKDAILFTTTAPCLECAKSIAAVGIKTVFYRDKYKNEDGINHLKQAKVEIWEFGIEN